MDPEDHGLRSVFYEGLHGSKVRILFGRLHPLGVHNVPLTDPATEAADVLLSYVCVYLHPHQRRSVCEYDLSDFVNARC